MTTKRNWTYILVAVIVRAFMLGAAAISFSHIVATSHALGLGWEAWTVPGFVDGLAVLGLIGRGPKFAPSTQRAGLRLMAGAGLLSLACNVYAGHNLGQQLYGVLVVAGFIAAEWYSMKLRPAPQVSAKRCPAGCTCMRHARNRPAVEQPAPVVAPEPVHVIAPPRTRRPTGRRIGAVAPGWMSPNVRLAVANAR